MSQGPLCPNLTKKFKKEVSQMTNRNFPWLIGGLSVNFKKHIFYSLYIKQELIPTNPHTGNLIKFIIIYNFQYFTSSSTSYFNFFTFEIKIFTFSESRFFYSTKLWGDEACTLDTEFHNYLQNTIPKDEEHPTLLIKKKYTNTYLLHQGIESCTLCVATKMKRNHQNFIITYNISFLMIWQQN